MPRPVALPLSSTQLYIIYPYWPPLVMPSFPGQAAQTELLRALSVALPLGISLSVMYATCSDGHWSPCFCLFAFFLQTFSSDLQWYIYIYVYYVIPQSLKRMVRSESWSSFISLQNSCRMQRFMPECFLDPFEFGTSTVWVCSASAESWCNDLGDACAECLPLCPAGDQRFHYSAEGAFDIKQIIPNGL